jgi:hypothetical protein
LTKSENGKGGEIKKKMANKKKKSGIAGKALLGATAVAAAAGVAALASNKKTRTRVIKGAKAAIKKAKADPRVQKAGKEAGGWVSKLGETISNWLK